MLARPRSRSNAPPACESSAAETWPTEPIPRRPTGGWCHSVGVPGRPCWGSGVELEDEDKVAEYTGRVGRLAARQAGEVELLEALPNAVAKVVDLGCGDGRLIELVLDAHPELTEATGLDNSPPMLDLARQRFAGQARVDRRARSRRRRFPVCATSTQWSRASLSITCPMRGSGRCSVRSLRHCDRQAGSSTSRSCSVRPLSFMRSSTAGSSDLVAILKTSWPRWNRNSR